MFEIRRYTPAQAREWNLFVEESKNGTFLFDRGYMDYHADRFIDHSLMVYRKGRLYALLPAHAEGNTLFSHRGLTYGGLITSIKATATNVCQAFQAIHHYLNQHHFLRVVYKPIPSIYQQIPAEEDLYALFMLTKPRLISRDIVSVIKNGNHPRFSELRRRGIRKAITNGLYMEKSTDFETFWQILRDNLMSTYHACPVHTLAEIQLLRSRFPENIRLFCTFSKDHRMLGGTVLYISRQVIRTQYISASPEGKRTGALDLLFDQIVNHSGFPQSYFDFGTSVLNNGNELNPTLMFQKEGFGCRAVCQDIYEYNL